MASLSLFGASYLTTTGAVVEVNSRITTGIGSV
jgi:hypothetical protein